MARTVTGTVVGVDNTASSWTLTFVPQDTPDVVDSAIVVGLDKRIVTDSVGAFSVILIEGRYTVQINNGEEFEIDVPSGSGSSAIGTLVVVEGSSASTVYTISGHGTPEGVKRGDPGFFYTDLDNGDLWRKMTGTGTTGWVLLIAT